MNCKIKNCFERDENSRKRTKRKRKIIVAPKLF
jgi:hypothetical protein